MAKVAANPFFAGMSGKLDNVVLVRQPTGLVLRPRVVPRNPNSAAQAAWRNAMKAAGAAYRALTMAQHAAWEIYARSLPATNGAAPRMVNVFMTLGAKAYFVNPAAGVPLVPPAAPFGGDGVHVQAAGGSGEIVFTASGPNAAGVVTELLLYKVSSVHTATFDKLYRTRAVAAFASGSLEQRIPVYPGCYACAVRFVESATGQQTGILRLGTVTAA